MNSVDYRKSVREWRRSFLSILMVLLCNSLLSCQLLESKEKAVEKTYLAYRKALFAGDIAALRTFMSKEKSEELDGPGASAKLALVKQFAPEKIEITKIKVKKEEAEIHAKGVKNEIQMEATIYFDHLDGNWQLSEEQWSVSLTASLGFTWASKLRQFPAKLPKERIRFTAHKEGITRLRFTPDGTRLLSLGYGSIRLWDANSLQLIGELKHGKVIRDFVIHPDGESLFAVDAYGRVGETELIYGGFGKEYPFSGTAGEAAQMAINGEGTLIAATGFDKAIGVWDIKSRKKIKELSGSSKMRGIAFAPEADVIAAGAYTNYFKVWNLQSKWGFLGNRKYKIPRAGEKSDVWSIAISPDGKYLATGHMDSSVSIWDFEKRDAILNTYVENAATMALAFSPDSTVLASGQNNGFIYFWDNENGERLARLQANPKSVAALAFSSDGQYLAAADENGEIAIWNY